MSLPLWRPAVQRGLEDHTRVTVIRCPHGFAMPVRCDRCIQEIDDGLRNLRWEPGSLGTHTLERVLIDALADMWRDCYRQGNPEAQRRMFRERMNVAITCATGEGTML